MRCKNICVILPGVLPFPAVKGGAVENLVWHYVSKNEEYSNFKITLYSPFDPEAEKAAKELENTEVEFVNASGVFPFLKRLACYFVNRILKIRIGNFYLREVKNKMGNADRFDAIIFENCPEYALYFKNYKGEKILHLHNDYLNSETKNSKEIFDCFGQIWCISEYIASRVATIAHSKKIKRLDNCVDLKLFAREFSDEEKDAIRESLNIPRGKMVVLYVGRIVKHKGVQELFEAFAGMRPREDSILLIVGTPLFGRSAKDLFLRKLKEEAKSMGDSVKFTGYVDYAKLNGIYAIADVLVVPSQWNEPSGLTVLEGMSMGRAMVVSDCGGIGELVENTPTIKIKLGKNYVKELREALELLLSNATLREEMGECNRRRGRLYSIDRYYDGIRNLLSSQN